MFGDDAKIVRRCSSAAAHRHHLGGTGNDTIMARPADFIGNAGDDTQQGNDDNDRMAGDMRRWSPGAQPSR